MTAEDNAYGGQVYAVERERRAGCAVWLASQCDGWSASCICRPSPATPPGFRVPVVPPRQRHDSDSDPQQHEDTHNNEG